MQKQPCDLRNAEGVAALAWPCGFWVSWTVRQLVGQGGGERATSFSRWVRLYQAQLPAGPGLPPPDSSTIASGCLAFCGPSCKQLTPYIAAAWQWALSTDAAASHACPGKWRLAGERDSSTGTQTHTMARATPPPPASSSMLLCGTTKA